MQVQLQMPELVLPANDKSGSDDDSGSSFEPVLCRCRGRCRCK